MTIYDELGLPADATDEQIRQAHRQLVKLLHPDLQQDAELRRMAERQLTRINRIVEQLLQSRTAETAMVRPMQGGVMDASAVFALHRAWQRREMGWKLSAFLLGGVATVALLALLLPERDRIRSHRPAAEPPQIAASTPTMKVEPPQPPAPVRRSSTAMPTAKPHEAIEVAEQDLSAADTEPPPMVAMREDVPAVKLPPSVTAPVAPVAAKPDLAGVWLYAGDPGPGGMSKLYPPEYIELRLGQEPDGTLHGEYRGRYAVTDLAISPSVSFRFREKHPNLAAVPWSGPRGAAGTLSLRLVRADVLQVTWKVTSATSTNTGGGAELNYGAATLIRRR